MRTEKIEIKNMGPFIDTEIDYTKVGTNGVVLIAGDTGAGKSTVYDAISYALYGKTSGGERDAAMLHNRTNNKTMSVNLFFSEQDKRYRIYRQRTASGTTTMRLFYLENGNEREELRKKDVSGQDTSPQKVLEREILHMNYDQFVKCYMLAQGKFREVLTDEIKRAKVLAGLFKTDRLGKLVDKITADYNALDKQVKDVKRDLETALADIKYLEEQAMEYAFCEVAAFYLDLEGNESRLKTLLEEEARALVQLDKDRENLNKSIAQEKVALTKAERYFRDKEELEEAQAKLPEALKADEAAKEDYATAEAEKNKEADYTIEAGQKQAILDDFDKLPQQVANYNKLEEDLTDKQKELEECKDLADKLEQAIKDERLRLEQLPNYGQQEEALRSKENSLKNTQKTLDDTKKQGEETGEADRKAKKAEAILKKAETALEDAQNAKELVEKAYNLSTQLEKEKSEQIAHKAPLDNLNNLLQECAGKQEELAKKQEEYKKDNAKYLQDKKVYEAAYQLFLDNQAGILAQGLEKADFCPVCGAAHIHFGTPATVQPQVKTEAEIKQLGEIAEASNKKRNTSSGAIGALLKDISQREETIRNKAKDLDALEDWADFEELKDKLEQALKAKQTEINRLEGLIEDQKKIFQNKKHVEDCITNHKKAVEDHKKKSDSHRALAEAYSAASALLTEKRKAELEAFLAQGFITDSPELQTALANYGTDSFSDADKAIISAAVKQGAEKLKTAVEQLTQEKQTLKAASEKAEKAKAALAEQEKKLKDLKDQQAPLTEALGTLKANKKQAKQDWEALEDKLAPYDQVAVKAKKEELEQKIEDNKTAFKTAAKTKEKAAEELSKLQEKIENKTKDTKGIVTDTTEEIKARITLLEGQYKAAKTNYEARSNNLTLNQQAEEKIHHALKEYRAYNKRLDVLKPLAQFIAGKESQGNKIDLETFAQGIYLDQVVLAANQLLQKLSKHRYSLKRRLNKTKDNKGMVTGLQLEVFDSWNGSLRDVKSMSGGEGFMASMALALGLAEVTKRQHGATTVESLFIDEGFGTLDAASLEQIMELLNDLSGSKRANGEDKTESEKRMVTIISHLDELGKTVSKQFLIEKSQQGSSVRYRDLNLEHH